MRSMQACSKDTNAETISRMSLSAKEDIQGRPSRTDRTHQWNKSPVRSRFVVALMGFLTRTPDSVSHVLDPSNLLTSLSGLTTILAG